MNGLVGHNNGPATDAGVTWRKHCWTRARADLIPHLPIEILRGRVKRAKEIGLDYKTYASVRASTGRDVVGFLFSSNALRAFLANATMPDDRRAKLASLIDCRRVALITAPLHPDEFKAANGANVLDHATTSPDFLTKWSHSGRVVTGALREYKLPADGVLLIGDTTLEREWSEAGRLAGYLPSDRYFVDAAH
jgi:hypothetical protein